MQVLSSRGKYNEQYYQPRLLAVQSISLPSVQSVIFTALHFMISQYSCHNVWMLWPLLENQGQSAYVVSKILESINSSQGMP